jgi:hypothetical protein
MKLKISIKKPNATFFLALGSSSLRGPVCRAPVCFSPYGKISYFRGA